MSAPKKPLFTTKTDLPGGIDKLVQVLEDLRTINTDGYLPGSTLLSWVADTPFSKVTQGVVCSPLTANAIAAAFDPDYSASRGKSKDDPVKPLFDGGKPLPFHDFYKLHNGDYPVPSIVNYGLGEAIHPEDLRRGDYVGLDWYFPPPPKTDPPTKQRYGGHSVFCWDVHLNAAGKVDCFQMIGSNGSISPPGGLGVGIYGLWSKSWYTGAPAGSRGAGKGDLGKPGNAPLFVDSPKIIAEGVWLVLPGVKESDLDKSFLAKGPRLAFPHDPKPKWGVSIAEIHCARFYPLDGPRPTPYCQTDGSPRDGGSAAAAASKPGTPAAATPPAAPSGPPGHMDVPSTPVPKADVKANPDAVKTVPPKPAGQDPAKPLAGQLNVELAMQEFFAAKWIATDPGSSDNINDAQTQAAIKDFQGKFGLDVDGIVGKHTKAMIALQLPACQLQLMVQGMLYVLKVAGVIKADPGPPSAANTAAMALAVKEFQKVMGLPQTGLPDAATQDKLRDKVSSAPSTTQHGLNPMLLSATFMGNSLPVGGKATLRLFSQDIKIGQAFQVFLKDAKGGKEVDAGVQLVVDGSESQVDVPCPSAFAVGTILTGRVTATVDGKKMETPIAVPVYVRDPSAPAATVAAGPVSDGLEVFFNYKGWIGETASMPSNPTDKQKHETWAKNKKFTYVGYRVPGKDTWFLRGRGMVDIDGAPNTYHPTKKNSVHPGELMYYDVMSLDRPLDSLADGPSGMQSKGGKLYVQGPNDPAPGYLVMATTLKRKGLDNWDPKKYADARVIPFMAMPLQILQQKNIPSTVDNFGGFEAVGKGHTGNTGDLVTVINLNPGRYPPVKGYTQEPSYPPDYLELIEIDGKKYPITHGIIGDAGNQPHIGECSYALAKAAHTLHGPAFADVLWMVHPGTGQGADAIPEPSDILAKGKELFEKWGGQAQLAKVLAKPELKVSGR